MSSLEPKEVASRFIDEAWNARLDSAVDELVHPDDQIGDQRGPDTVRANIASYVAAFPDLRLTILDMIGEGDRVAVRVLLEGAQEGSFGGIPAAGRRVAFWHVEDGMLREGAFIAQALSLRIQLGVLSATFWQDPRFAPAP